MPSSQVQTGKSPPFADLQNAQRPCDLSARATESQRWPECFSLADGLSEDDRDRLDGLASLPRIVRCGESVYHAGAPFRALYAIRTGFLKGTVMHQDGTARIVDVYFGGDVVGMDGMDRGVRDRDVVALEDSTVSELAFSSLERLARSSLALQRNLHRLFSQEIVEGHRQMLLLGTMQAPQKIAAFILRLSQRLARRGRNPDVIHLPMTRAEIGSHLGLTFETVSRTISRMQGAGMLDVRGKQIRIVRHVGLSDLLSARS